MIMECTKADTCEHCSIVDGCMHAYSKPVLHTKYSKMAYSKSVGWNGNKRAIPSEDELINIIKACRKGNQQQATHLFKLYRYCKSPSNEGETARMNMLYAAFHELFG